MILYGYQCLIFKVSILRTKAFWELVIPHLECFVRCSSGLQQAGWDPQQVSWEAPVAKKKPTKNLVEEKEITMERMDR